MAYNPRIQNLSERDLYAGIKLHIGIWDRKKEKKKEILFSGTGVLILLFFSYWQISDALSQLGNGH